VARLKRFSRNTVNVSKLILAVRSLAAAFPDFIYEKPNKDSMCLYKRTRQPGGEMSGCIIGEALRKTGVSTAGLDKAASSGINYQLDRVGLLPEDARQSVWLAEVQSEQDSGHTWAEAVRIADQNAPLA